MGKFVPKDLIDDEWEFLTPGRSYAVLSNDEHPVYLRLGRGRSYYIGGFPVKPDGRILNSIEYENGNTSVLYRLSNLSSVTAGRTSECAIKIINPVISRQHIKFYLDGNILMVRDEGSRNGTFIHTQNVYFSIDEYLQHHPLDKVGDKTLDEVHMTFGMDLDNFFKRYMKLKEIESQASSEPEPTTKETDNNDIGQNEAANEPIDKSNQEDKL